MAELASAVVSSSGVTCFWTGHPWRSVACSTWRLICGYGFYGLLMRAQAGGSLSKPSQENRGVAGRKGEMLRFENYAPLIVFVKTQKQ